MPKYIEKEVVYMTPKEKPKPELRLPPKGTKKKCNKCGFVYDATPEHFEPTPAHGYYILRGTCRTCRGKQKREYWVSHSSYYSAARKVAKVIKKEGGDV